MQKMIVTYYTNLLIPLNCFSKKNHSFFHELLYLFYFPQNSLRLPLSNHLASFFSPWPFLPGFLQVGILCAVLCLCLFAIWSLKDDQAIDGFSYLEVGLGKEVMFVTIHVIIIEFPKICQQPMYCLFTSKATFGTSLNMHPGPLNIFALK